MAVTRLTAESSGCEGRCAGIAFSHALVSWKARRMASEKSANTLQPNVGQCVPPAPPRCRFGRRDALPYFKGGVIPNGAVSAL
jgi:hypothetical protein